jgi:hypothetical protein
MKKILFSIFILSVTMSFTIDNGKSAGENGKLSGIVTFKDSYELSNRADAGGEIYAISETDLKSTQYGELKNVVENFQNNKSFYSLARYNTLDIGRIVKLQDDFDNASKFALDYISGFRKSQGVVRTSANATGNYTLSLKPGRNYILFISGNVKSDNILESHGNVDFKIVDIKSAGGTFQNVSFERMENMMILLLTARQREGC